MEGYHAPGEWEPHASCLIGWPWRVDVWPHGGEKARPAFLEVIKTVCKSEKVIVIANPGTFTESHRKDLSSEIASNQVEIHPLVCDDAWLRDTGPTFVVNEGSTEVRGVDWKFNGWGSSASTSSWRRDAEVARQICKQQGLVSSSTDLVCEGGALAFDGDGTVISTESVLMDENRNPGKTKQEIEDILLSFLGARKLIWLPEGVYGDLDTRGHVDNLVAFARPGEVVLTWTDDKTDPQCAISKKTEDILLSATDARGRTLIVHRLHQPGAILLTEEEAAAIDTTGSEVTVWSPGKRLPASYVNFYVSNEVVVVPQFAQPERDGAALKVLKGLFPKREVVGVQSRQILIGGGNIHCITQQVPLVL